MKQTVMSMGTTNLIKICYVCKGRADLIREAKYNGQKTYHVRCVECDKCKTASYKTTDEAVNAYRDKILY